MAAHAGEPEVLKRFAANAPTVMSRLQPLLQLWQQGQLRDPEIALCFILVHVQVHFPRTWFGGLDSSPGPEHKPGCCMAASPRLDSFPSACFQFSPSILRRICQHGPPTLLTLTHCRLHLVPRVAMRTVRQWLLEEWALTLMTIVPKPIDVLRMQCAKHRVVSMLKGEAELAELHFGHDALDFLVHDLVHADRMFGRGEQHFCQHVGALRLLLRTLESGLLAQWLATDIEFRNTLDYAISDMNTHCLHTLQFVKHATMAAHLRGHGLRSTDMMTPLLEQEYYTVFFPRLIGSWMLSADAEESVRPAMNALCERSLSGDHDASFSCSISIHHLPFPAVLCD